jgi:hypothetical protein
MLELDSRHQPTRHIDTFFKFVWLSVAMICKFLCTRIPKLIKIIYDSCIYIYCHVKRRIDRMSYVIYIYKGKGHPITGHQGSKGGRDIALLIFELGARRGWVVSTTPRPLYPGKDTVPIVQEAEWVPARIWTCAKNFAPTGFRSPDSPARSQSQYQLSYPVHNIYIYILSVTVHLITV